MSANLFELEIDSRGNKIRYLQKRRFKPIHSIQFGQKPQIFKLHQQQQQQLKNQSALMLIRLRMKLQDLNYRVSALELKLSEIQEENKRQTTSERRASCSAASFATLLWFAWPILVQTLISARRGQR